MKSRVLLNYDNKITQKYRKGYHEGIDVIGDNGANNNMGYADRIVAHTQGTVIELRTNYRTTDRTGSSYGNYVLIQHDNGYRTLYAHLKYNSIKVVKGQKVLQGEIIGSMGATGHAFGVHLHFEVRDNNNKRLDPTNYIDNDLPVIDKEEVKEEPKKLTDKELLELVKRTIRGDFGSGDKRRKKLGSNYSIVQHQVNLNYKHGTQRYMSTIKLYKE